MRVAFKNKIVFQIIALLLIAAGAAVANMGMGLDMNMGEEVIGAVPSDVLLMVNGTDKLLLVNGDNLNLN